MDIVKSSSEERRKLNYRVAFPKCKVLCKETVQPAPPGLSPRAVRRVDGSLQAPGAVTQVTGMALMAIQHGYG
jgi:hypothetical protein